MIWGYPHFWNISIKIWHHPFNHFGTKVGVSADQDLSWITHSLLFRLWHASIYLSHDVPKHPEPEQSSQLENLKRSWVTGLPKFQAWLGSGVHGSVSYKCTVSNESFHWNAKILGIDSIRIISIPLRRGALGPHFALWLQWSRSTAVLHPFSAEPVKMPPWRHFFHSSPRAMKQWPIFHWFWCHFKSYIILISGKQLQYFSDLWVYKLCIYILYIYIRLYGGFLKCGYPWIIHLIFGFSIINHLFWGTMT